MTGVLPRVPEVATTLTADDDHRCPNLLFTLRSRPHATNKGTGAT